MSSSDQADRKSAQPFGFHQLRQACEISTLRQDITRILTSTADLQILIEHEVEQVRQRLGALSPAELQEPGKLSPLLGEALTALIEIREASRRLESNLGRRDQPVEAARPPARPAPAAPLQPRPRLAEPPPAMAAPAPVREPPPSRPPPAFVAPAAQPAHPTPVSPLAAPRSTPNRAKVMNWLMPVNR